MNDTMISATEKVNQLMAFTLAQSLPEEDWREVMIEDSCYFISSCGRVLSLQGRQPRLLRPWIQNDGYYYVELKGRKYRVNRLVAIAFRDNPKRKPIAHHKDGNKLNNHANNLEWVSPMEHAQKHRQMRKDKTL